MNYIFDFDGTICDSFDLFISIINKYSVRFNKGKISPNDIRNTGIEALSRKYKLNKFQVILLVYMGRREFVRHISELRVFPNLSRVLRILSKKNTLYIVSSNSKKNIEKFLKKNDLGGVFDFVVGSPSLFQKDIKIKKVIKKYNLKKEETYYIGDEIRDVIAGQKSGVKTIAVSWGYESSKLLHTVNPNMILNDPKELLTLPIS